MKKIILASGSPRRKELMERAGFEFEIIVSQKEENITESNPEDAVKALSEMKALDVASMISGEAYIIGADTVVAFEGHILGKPEDEEDALRMLKMLQGNTHQVYTGVTIVEKTGEEFIKTVFAEKTDVTMYPVAEKDLLDYIKTGEPMDKAGSYGIQGKANVFVKGICGDYENVVGLPIARIWNFFKETGGI